MLVSLQSLGDVQRSLVVNHWCSLILFWLAIFGESSHVECLRPQEEQQAAFFVLVGSLYKHVLRDMEQTSMLCLPACAQVRYLKVIEKSGYQALPWVRYITCAGNYEIRIGN